MKTSLFPSIIFICMVTTVIATTPIQAKAENANATSTSSAAQRTSAKESTTPISSPLPPEQQDDQATQNIRNRIEKVLEEKVTGTASLRKKRALVGTIDRISAETITISTMHGTENIKLSASTNVLLTPKLTPIQMQDVELHSFCVVMGFVDEDSVFEARRILIHPQVLYPTAKEILVGTIQYVSKTSITLMLRNQEVREIALTKKTAFRDANNEKITKADLENNMEVVVIVPTGKTVAEAAIKSTLQTNDETLTTTQETAQTAPAEKAATPSAIMIKVMK